MTTDPLILADYVNKFIKTPVLCIGDVMLDRFVYGKVDRISPEAPVPVLRIEREEEMLGGAGNVVRNLVALGGTPSLMGATGFGTRGEAIRQMLEKYHVDSYLVKEEHRRTSVKTRYVGGGQQVLRADAESLLPLSEKSQQDILSHVEKALPEIGALILSDYGKGVLTFSVLRHVLEAAEKAGVPTIVDPKGDDYSQYRGATLVTPNLKELSEATRHSVETDAEIVAAAQGLIEKTGIKNVLVTRSKDGMTLVKNNGDVAHLPAQAKEVYDVSGAGDTVVAVMAIALGADVPMDDAARLANVAGALVVAKTGTATVTAKEMADGLHAESLSHDEEKILPLETALETVARWQVDGKKVGFTNGCFDLVHPGHISLLRQSKAACDKLIIGLNSDASVKRLKGETRPVQNEMARAIVLSSMDMVDMVVLFSEDTPYNLVSAIKPDVMIKGADYKVEEIAGADVVQSYGGKIVLIDLVEGQSTSSMIERSK